MNKNKNLKLLVVFFLTVFFCGKAYSASKELLKVDWSFAGLTGKIDRASLQRGYQVYKEVCSSCHSMKYLSYRNLGQ
jgi:ubiquinol-cytochrome c reductase cytochrome c1 subunit